MSDTLKYIILAIAGYLIGSFSFGMTTSQVTHGPDLRKVGSGNTGASNALRAMDTKRGLIVFLGDFAKGALACGLGWWLTGSVYGAMLAGLCAVIGHNWPVYYGFHGGKGVSTSTAVGLCCFPIPALIGYAAAILAIWATRFISLGSMIFVVLFALFTTILAAHGDWLIIAWAWVLALMCVWRHRSNIKRLLRGEERKIGEKL